EIRKHTVVARIPQTAKTIREKLFVIHSVFPMYGTTMRQRLRPVNPIGRHNCVHAAKRRYQAYDSFWERARPTS
ncbi:hypothetical protein, partial [Oricola cellulosilytica]|uniref:hypothetical protein n=1 Tax=Oricola cellulosilytica TaxID=1429082 RepID=UPI001CBB5903